MKAIRLNNTFRAFKNRNYQLFFTGQLISRIGMWTQRTAVIWLIYSWTHSTFYLGLTVFAEQFPSFLFSIYGGIIADRFDRYKILMVTQISSAIQAILLTILIFTHHNSVWQILALSVFLGIINAFDVPARQPLVHDVIDDEADLPNAIALTSSLNNIARLIGPALSGILLQAYGAGTCFAINAVSFIAVIFSLMLMKLPKYIPRTTKRKAITELVEGFQYIKKTHEIGLTLLIVMLLSFFVLPYNTLLPVFAKVIFKGDASTFGYINSFIGVGAICGALYLASLKSKTNLKKLLLINILLLGVGLIFFSQISNFPLAMAFAIITGFGTMTQSSICNTIIQQQSAIEMRGRVIGYYAMAVFGMLPLGSLLIGFVSKHISTTTSILIQGFIAIGIGLYFYRFLYSKPSKKMQKLRPVRANQVLQEIE